jgi:hypothetical protein
MLPDLLRQVDWQVAGELLQRINTCPLKVFAVENQQGCRPLSINALDVVAGYGDGFKNLCLLVFGRVGIGLRECAKLLFL